MGPSTSSGQAQNENSDEEDSGSQYYDMYESDDQTYCTLDKHSDEPLSLPPKSTLQHAISTRNTSTRTVSLPIIPANSNNEIHRRSSNSTTRTNSRPTTATSNQTSSKSGSTAPTSINSSRRNSKRYSTLNSQLNPFSAPSQETRRLLHRSVTTTPHPCTRHYPSLSRASYIDDTIPPPIIRGISYPGRRHERTTTTSHSTPKLPLLPSSPPFPFPLQDHSLTDNNENNPPPPSHTFTNFHPASNIDWTLPCTRRKQYSKIDRATTGLRGVWTRYAPRRFGGGSRYGRFYDGDEAGGNGEEGGSVRRFRMEVGVGEGDEGVGKVVKGVKEGIKKWRVLSLGRGRGRGAR